MAINGSTTAANREPAPDHAPADHHDPAYDLPFVGALIREADKLRQRLPMGPELARTEAEALRMQARALRLVATYLDGRAHALEARDRERPDAEPRVHRVQID